VASQQAPSLRTIRANSTLLNTLAASTAGSAVSMMQMHHFHVAASVSRISDSSVTSSPFPGPESVECRPEAIEHVRGLTCPISAGPGESEGPNGLVWWQMGPMWLSRVKPPEPLSRTKPRPLANIAGKRKGGPLFTSGPPFREV
jgi:hypothetical protein